MALDLTPLRQETVASIRARIDADINAGKDPEDPRFWDMTPGTPAWDITQTMVLEIQRLWDAASVDAPAAAFVETAWGEYLDLHGAEIDVPRHGPVRATGEVTLQGDDGTIVPVGYEMATLQVGVDDDPVLFRTTEGGVIDSGEEITLPVEAVEAGGEGNVVAGAIQIATSDLEGITAAPANADPITGGADDETDERYRERLKIENSIAQGAGAIADYRRWALDNASVGFVRVVPLWNGAGTVRIIANDINNDPLSDVVVRDLQRAIDPYVAETTLDGGHTLPDSTIEVDSTEGFPEIGRGYVDGQLVEWTGTTATSLTGATGGTGAVSAGAAVVVHGRGGGLAPPGALATVNTSAWLAVGIEATLALRDGYSIDGSDGKIPVEADIEAILGDYVNGLPPGGEDPPGAESPAGSGFVLLNKVESCFFQVEGVYNVSGVEINTVAGDLAVDPLQVPRLGTVVLT